MPSVSTNDLKNGMGLTLDDGLFTVVEFQHVKPGKGGAFVRTKLRNVRTGAVIERTYRAAETLEQAVIDKRDMSFLYRDGGRLRLHGPVHLRPALRRPAARSATRPTTCERAATRSSSSTTRRSWASTCPRPSSSSSPTPSPGIQGDRVSGARKPATLETGLVVQVPLFVNPGESIKVDTRTGEYLTRA